MHYLLQEYFLPASYLVRPPRSIAERLGISRRTVENQLTRALRHLRHSLGDLDIVFMALGSTVLIIK